MYQRHIGIRVSSECSSGMWYNRASSVEEVTANCCLQPTDQSQLLASDKREGSNHREKTAQSCSYLGVIQMTDPMRNPERCKSVKELPVGKGKNRYVVKATLASPLSFPDACLPCRFPVSGLKSQSSCLCHFAPSFVALYCKFVIVSSFPPFACSWVLFYPLIQDIL